MSYWQRIKSILRNKKRFAPVAEVTAGRAAELQMASILSDRLRGSSFEFSAGLRIPHKGGRREIDFVITTPDEIWLVELKNWSGFVGLDGGRVIQHRSHGRGMVDHGRLLNTMRTKERALENYLRPKIKDVPPMVSILVFCNDNLGIAEELLELDDILVAKYREFLAALPAAPPDYGFLWGMVRKLLGSGNDEKKRLENVSDEIRAARTALAEVGTWDLLVLHGGRILSGDIRGISPSELDDRQRLKSIRFRVPRSYFQVFQREFGATALARERSGSEVEVAVGFDDVIRFHAAGQSGVEEFLLRDVEAVAFG